MRERVLAVLLGAVALTLTACVPAGDGGSAETGRGGPKEDDTATAVTTTATPAGDEVPPLETDERLLAESKLLKGRANIVRVNNRADGKIKVRTNLQFNRIEGDQVTPENVAEVYSNCKGCQSFAIAVQINVYERGASFILPRNAAVAVNDHCDGCVSIARAYQYVIPVDDVDSLPDNVDRLVRAINKEAHYFEQIKSQDEVDPAEIQTRLSGILAQFAELDAYLTQAMAEETEPAGEARSGEATPTPSPAVTPTGTAIITPTGTAAITPTPTETAQPTTSATAGAPTASP